jgi:glutamyl-Q tRNA(Asp) synthetase
MMTEGDRVRIGAELAARVPAQWRTRFAPAPTGALHLGHAVNAVFVWSLARAFGGTVVLRIEDHDQRRSSAAAERGIRADLLWLGLHADIDEPSLPSAYRQSDSGDVYATALDQLATRSLIYACQCSRKGLEPGGAADERRYPGTCRTANVDVERWHSRRVRLPDASVTFHDLRHGSITQTPSTQCGDVLVRDRFSQWTYQFAVVVDDVRHGIDVVIRGDDLLASTGRQLLLRTLLKTASPIHFLHHPLVRAADGRKLSKSAGDTGLSELRAAGWAPAEVLGHAAWLGGLLPDPQPVAVDALATLWR